MNYYIKERHNGQSEPYFVRLGQLPAKEAKSKKKSLAGFNIIHSFKTKSAYETKVAELVLKGKLFL